MELRTVGDKLFWSYANLAMLHAAVSHGSVRLERVHYAIRARHWRQLSAGGRPGSLIDDERLKLVLPQACSYCGNTDRSSLTVDHLLAKHRGGTDAGENLVWACRSCNSSKRDRDVLECLESRGELPSVLLLRRYLKLAIELAAEHGLLQCPLEAATNEFPFALGRIPLPGDFPPLSELRLWIIDLND